MSIIIYNDIHCDCPICTESAGSKKIRVLILWANQHGAKVRLFCKGCHSISDMRKLNDKVAEVSSRSWQHS